jgi:hypothetical protein
MPRCRVAETPGGRTRFNRLIDIKMWDGWLSSNYHSLQTTVNRRFSNGLLLKGAYTWSKAINMADDNGWVGVNWNSPEVIHRNRARAGYDRTHVFQMAYVYELALGMGKSFLNSGPFFAFTGNPFNITGGHACNCPRNLQTADQVKPEVTYNRDAKSPGEKYFDTTAFAPAQANSFGSLGRNVITGPGRIGMDMSIARIFPVGERFRFEFRADAFNITNTPWFSNPQGSATSATFGEIRSTVTQSGREVSTRQFRLGAVIRF